MSIDMTPMNVPGDGQPAFTLMERMAQSEATLKQLQDNVALLLVEAEKVRDQLTRVTHAVNDMANALVVQQNAMLSLQAAQRHHGIIYPS